MSGGSQLVRRLAALTHPVADSQGVEQVASNLGEALEFLGREPDGQAQLHIKAWKEYFAEREQRLYYVNDEVGYNSWDAPPCFKFDEWFLDAQLYSISLTLARDIYETLDSFLTRHPPEVVFKALSTLARLVGNVADCSNEVERYRAVKVDNPKFHEAVWQVPGAAQILLLVGFKRQGQHLSIAADVPLGPVQAAAARLRRLADRKGHSGAATLVKIWHCSVCSHPINDGSERLWTGKHDAPPGEFRYLCTTCEAAGTNFNLCESCWDRHQEQQQQQQQRRQQAQPASSSEAGGGSSREASAAVHDVRHAFQHIGPRMTRHNDYYNNRGSEAGSDPANPWGRPRNGGASLQRALQRLGDRYGVRQWINDGLDVDASLPVEARLQNQQNNQQKQQQHDGACEHPADGFRRGEVACNDHRCCAERRLISTCVMEAKRRGVQPHKVAAYVRRRLGGGVAILRFRADGSRGCSAPCTLCARELLKYDLKVACLLENGEVFRGRLTDPGAPPSKVTGGQRAWLTYWTSCQRRGQDPAAAAGGIAAGDRAGSPGRHRTALLGEVRSADGTIQTAKLLEVCRSILPIVDKLGTGFALVKHDVGGNIDRLATCAATKPEAYGHDAFQMVRDDVAAGTHTASSSVTKGLLWLKRAMEFIVALLDKLYTDRNITLSAAASETYYATLQQYHGWIVTGTFTVALKLVPSREAFFDKVGATAADDASMQHMHAFCTAFGGLLADIQRFLAENDLDDPAKERAQAGTMAEAEENWLPRMTKAFIALDSSSHAIDTAAFAAAMEKVLPIFEKIGTVFLFARHEFATKVETIVAVAPRMSTLDQVVLAGKKDATITRKNSPARNVHRLLNTLNFIAGIFENLAKGMGLKDAVSDAYDRTLAQIHAWVVRAGIKTGMMALPTRECFLTSIGETEESALHHAEGFVVAAHKLVGMIEKLYVGVEMPSLIAALGACQSPDPLVRKAGEAALEQSKHARGQVVSLLRVALEDSVDPAVRQVAAISFKNLVKRDWDVEEGKVSPLAEEDKAAVRGVMVEGVTRSPHAVRVQLAECVRKLVYSDYPQHWPELLPQVQQYLDQARISGALCVLRFLARKYEFRDEEERAPLEAVINATFPILLHIFQMLLAMDSSSPELAELLKLVCKTFWSATYMSIPACLNTEQQFTGWMTCFHGLMMKPLPLDQMPADVDARKSWQWNKAKKWVWHIASRLFNRYGDPKLCTDKQDIAFAQRFQKECSLVFMEAGLAQLAVLGQGGYQSSRVITLLLSYITQALAYSHTWKVLKPHVGQMLLHVVFPLLCFSDEDAELWEEDPQEYIRKGYDIMEDMYSSKTAAMSFLHELCKARAKGNLDMLMAHLVDVCNTYKGAHPVAPTELARRMDGALLAIGTLADVLKNKKPYSDQLEPMLLQHVVPLFASPHSHLRAKACWLAGIYADIQFHDGQGQGPTFAALLQHVVAAIADPDLPVRMDAAVSVRSFLDAVEEENLDELRPLVPRLLNQFLTLSNELDNEDLTFSLETVIEKFADDMAPYAAGLMQQLVLQFWRIVSDGEGEAEGGGGAGNDEDGGDDGVLAAYGVLRAMSTVLESIHSLPELYQQMEEILWPILDKFSGTEGQDIFEEVMQLATYLTYYAPTLSPRMWSLYPRLLECVSEWAIDYFVDVLLPVDNYISKGTEVFLTSQAPPYLALTNRMLEQVLGGDGYPEEQVVCAPRLMGVILQHCRGRVDPCVGPYLSLVLRRLAPGVESQDLGDALMCVLGDALYYSPALCLQQLAAQGALQQALSALSSSIFAIRKSGKMKHYSSPREKKVLVLGLVSLLSLPDSQLPQEVKPGMPLVTSAVLRLLLALKQQQEEHAAGSGGSSEAGSGNESDLEDESEEGVGRGAGELSDDEDEVDEAYLKRLARMAAKRAGGGSDDDDDDSGDEYWSEDEEEEVASPIDSIDPFIYFAETLHAVQHSEPARFAGLVGGLDANVQRAVQGMMQYAAELKEEQAQEAAAAAAAAAAAPAAAETVIIHLEGCCRD
ncbi:Importin beta-like SAD2 [Chlorella vulgaris]